MPTEYFNIFMSNNLDSVTDVFSRPITPRTDAGIRRILSRLGRNVIVPNMVSNTPRASNRLVKSTNMSTMMVAVPMGRSAWGLVITQNARNKISGTVYQPFVSKGRRPGRRPPYQALEFWVALRFGLPWPSWRAKSAAFVLARSIGIRGVRPNLYLQRVIMESAHALDDTAVEIGKVVVAEINARVRPVTIPKGG